MTCCHGSHSSPLNAGKLIVVQLGLSWRTVASCSRAIRRSLSATGVRPLKMHGRPCSYRVYACISQSGPRTQTPRPRPPPPLPIQISRVKVTTLLSRLVKDQPEKETGKKIKKRVADSFILLPKVEMSNQTLKETGKKECLLKRVWLPWFPSFVSSIVFVFPGAACQILE